MWYRKLVLVAITWVLGMVLTGLSANAAVTPIIVQSGFDPEWVELEETASDNFNGSAYSNVTNEEIPVEDLAFSWRISYASFYDFETETWYPLSLGEDCTYYEDDYCVLEIIGSEYQNCELQGTLYYAGYIYVEVELAVEYPVGY
jgi:hypothetical protein